MGFFDSVKEGFEKVVKTSKDTYNRERENTLRDKREAQATSKAVKNPDGTYTTTDSKGNKITSGFAPGEAVRKNAGSGFDMFNPELMGAADNRGVGLYTAYRGGQLMSTPQYDKSFLSRDGGFNMDYNRMHMNPLEFMNAYNREQAGQRVNWQQEGFAGQFSPVPESIRNLQDLYRQLGYSYNGGYTPMMPQYPTTLPAPAPNGNGGINPGGMYNQPQQGGGTVHAGGTPYFDEKTGQYTYPTAPNGNAGINPGGNFYDPYGGRMTWGGGIGGNPMTGLPYGMGGFNPYGGFGGGYGYGGYGGMNGGINPGGMYSGGYMGGYNNFDPSNMLMALLGPGLFGY